MKRHFNTSFKEANMHKQRNPAKESPFDQYSRRYGSPSPFRQELSRKAPSGLTNYSSEDDHEAFCPPSHESLQRDSYKRNSAHSLPDDEQLHSRSFLKEQKETENYPIPTETKSQEPKSKSGGLLDFIPGLHALPTELFLKIVLCKLDEMEVDGFTELSELAKFISKAQDVFAKTLPPEIEAVVKQMMFSKVGINHPKSPTQLGSTQVSESRQERKDPSPETDISLIRDILMKANRKDLPLPSASSNVASHQNIISNPGTAHGSYPGTTHGSYPGTTQGNYPTTTHGNYPGTTHGNYPGTTHGNYPSTTQGNYPGTTQGNYPATTQGNYPGTTHGNYAGTTHENVNAPYTNTYTPSSNESYSYNTASSSMTPGIPGLTLTEEQRESYSAYNAYQSQYSQPSLSNYHNFKF